MVRIFLNEGKLSASAGREEHLVRLLEIRNFLGICCEISKKKKKKLKNKLKVAKISQKGEFNWKGQKYFNLQKTSESTKNLENWKK